ncbi:hypothetical protein C8Q72DRAFT_594225 [Fomitopsis betulina]|nr:hypothetical protein C8Q72DRAFT_594225 [Fomitopsis betulina]
MRGSLNAIVTRCIQSLSQRLLAYILMSCWARSLHANTCSHSSLSGESQHEHLYCVHRDCDHAAPDRQSCPK